MNENQKNDIDDATIIVSKKELDEATTIVSKQIVEDVTAALDEATIVVGGLNSVEEETITNSNPINEDTISSTRTGDHDSEFTFTGTGEPAPTPTRAIPIVQASPEPDAELKVEDFIDPDVANETLRINKVEQTKNLNLPEYDDRIIRTAPANTKVNSLNDAAKLMKKNDRRAKTGIITVTLVILGAALIGSVAAILVNGF
jgi:hypothetical protein